jgi:hypothetical protein
MTFRWEADACSAPALKIGIDRPYKSDATWNSSTEGDTAQRRHGLVTHGWHGNAGAMPEHWAALALPDGTPFSSVIGTYTGDIVASPLQSRTVRFAFEMRLRHLSPYVHAGPIHRFISPAQDTVARDTTDARHDGTGPSVPDRDESRSVIPARERIGHGAGRREKHSNGCSRQEWLLAAYALALHGLPSGTG